MLGGGSQFRYLPVGVVSEDIVVVREGNGNKGEFKISD